MTDLLDSWQRQINYLRISVTDRCNLRCIYCTTRDMAYLKHEEVLRYEEIFAVARAATGLGINKIRLTGGEPLVRLDLSQLVAMISGIEGIDDIALTTNGVLLSQYATELKKAGLKRVNVSLDTLKEDKFRRITGLNKLREVLSGIETAREAGLDPVKINMVVLRGINDDEVLDFARMSIREGWHVRFIEFMPFGASQDGTLNTVSSLQVQEKIQSLGQLEPFGGSTGNGPAKYYQIPGAGGTIGFITPMTEHFCHTCNRLRLTSDGQLRPCLLEDDEIDLKTALRSGEGVEKIKQLILQAVAAKRNRHRLAGGAVTPQGRTMCQIGG